jgi:hypothetical protein
MTAEGGLRMTMTNFMSLNHPLFTGGVLFPEMEKLSKMLNEESKKTNRIVDELKQEADRFHKTFIEPLISTSFESTINRLLDKKRKRVTNPKPCVKPPIRSQHSQKTISVGKAKSNTAKTACACGTTPIKKTAIRCRRSAHDQLCTGVVAQTVALIDPSFRIKKAYKHPVIRFLGKGFKYKSDKTIRRWLKGVDFALVEQIKSCALHKKDEFLRSAKENVSHEKPSKSCSRGKHDKMICRAIARTLWFYFSEMKINQVCRHDAMIFFGNTLRYQGKDTIRDWIKDIAPSHTPGRPKKAS